MKKKKSNIKNPKPYIYDTGSVRCLTDDDIAANDGGLVPRQTGNMQDRRVSDAGAIADHHVVHIPAHHGTVPQRRSLPNLGYGIWDTAYGM